MNITIGTTYGVETKSRGRLGTALVTDVYIDGHHAGEVDVYSATGTTVTRVEGCAYRRVGLRADKTYTDTVVYSDNANGGPVRVLKSRAVEAIVRFWHDNYAVRYRDGR